METYIELEKMNFYAYHGVLEQEKIVGNNFEVNIKIKVDFTNSLLTDELDDTVSYADIFEVIKYEMSIPSKLLEHVAGRIISSIYNKWSAINEIEIKLSKCKPPISGDIQKASVFIKWQK